MEWMLDIQLGRRNLSPIQRIAVTEKYRSIYEKQAQENQSKAGGDKKSKCYQKSLTENLPQAISTKERNPTVRKILSDAAGVSEDTYSKGKKILDSDNEELKQEVLSGEKSINAGYKELTQCKNEEKVHTEREVYKCKSYCCGWYLKFLWRELIMNKNRKQSDKKPKKAPLVYINRVEMKELDEDNKYEFIPDIVDANGNIVNRNDLNEEEQKKYDKAVMRKINHDKRKHMILTSESELIRIIRFLSKEDEVTKRKTKASRINRDYVENMLSLKVGRSYTKYRDKMKASKGIVTYNGKRYKRIIVSSSHSRTQKAMLVAENIWDKAMDILLCGIDRDTEYKFMSKWNSYIGLVATDSIPVSMPNIVIVDDKEIRMKAKVDVVREVDTWDKKGNIYRKFSVLHDKVKRIPTNLFDGAGIVTVKKAEEWSKELNLDYIPASFQFRCIPCLKGKLYTMPVEEFAKTYSVSKIIDINGKEWDLFVDKIDCILTKSQFKFHDLYNSIEKWREEFDKKTHSYKRTFNISEYDMAFSELEDTTVMAYQPLQTLSLSENGIKRICSPTVKSYTAACKSVEGF